MPSRPEHRRDRAETEVRLKIAPRADLGIDKEDLHGDKYDEAVSPQLRFARGEIMKHLSHASPRIEDTTKINTAPQRINRSHRRSSDALHVKTSTIHASSKWRIM